MLNSAFILPLPKGIKWGSSIAPGNALSTVSSTTLPLGAQDGTVEVIQKYATRDRELAYRDLVIAGQLSKLAFRLSTTWNFSPAYFKLQGPAGDRLEFNASDLKNTPSQGLVTYVGSSSVPADALETDKELYERDLIAAQELAKSVAPVLKWNSPVWSYRISNYSAGTVVTSEPHQYSSGFGVVICSKNGTLPSGLTASVDPTVSITYFVRVISETSFTLHLTRSGALTNMGQVSVSGSPTGDEHYSVFSGFGLTISSAWSPANAVESAQDINPALPLNVDLFKTPDQELAFRDNQLAAHAANLVHLVQNPFEVANRLLVDVVHSSDPEDPLNRLREPYALIQETADVRIWAAEPLLSGRNRLVYDKNGKTLQWFSENHTIHAPQPADYEISGPSPSQSITILPELPGPDEANHWAVKAGRLQFPGIASGTIASVPNPGNALIPVSKSTLKLSSGNALICAPGTASFQLSGSAAIAWSSGTYQVGDIVSHSGNFYVATRTTTATPSSTNSNWKQVSTQENVRVSVLAVPLSVVELKGTEQSSAVPLDLEEGVEFGNSNLSAWWDVALPTGSWELEVFYMSKASTPSAPAYQVNIQYGSATISTTPLVYGVTTGTVVSSKFVVPTDGSIKQLKITWTNGAGSASKLVVRKITFKSSLTDNVEYGVACRLGTLNLGKAVVTTQRDLPFSFSVLGSSLSNISDPILQLVIGAVPAPLRIIKIDAKLEFPLTGAGVTVAAAGFEYWRLEMRRRYADTVRESYGRSMAEYMVHDGDIVAGTSYRVIDGSIRYAGIVYEDGDQFDGAEDATYAVIDGNPVVVDDSNEFPELAPSGTWTKKSTSDWLELVAKHDRSLWLSLKDPYPSDIGAPALVPNGLEIQGSTAVNKRSTRETTPTIQAFQAWMEPLGIKCLNVLFKNPSDRLGWVGEFGRPIPVADSVPSAEPRSSVVLVCSDDLTHHVLSVYLIKGYYTLVVDNIPPTSIPTELYLRSTDSTVHRISVRLFGGKYTAVPHRQNSTATPTTLVITAADNTDHEIKLVHKIVNSTVYHTIQVQQ